MLQRVSRLSRRASDVYFETGSVAAALRYVQMTVSAKARLAFTHVLAMRRFVSPWQMGAELRRIDALRTEGRLAVAINVSGGLGDLIVIARFIRDLSAEVEPFAFDIFAPSPELARWVFRSVPGFADAFPDTLHEFAGKAYDIGFNVNQTVTIQHRMTLWKRLREAPLFAAAMNRMGKMRRRGLEPYIVNHPRLDNGLARKAVYWERSRRDFLHLMAGVPYGSDQLDVARDAAVLQRHGLAGRDYVTVHNGFDANFLITGPRATKCYPHFAEVVAGLKAARPDLLVVQMGTTTSEPIPGVDLDLIGRTNLLEVAGLLTRTRLHLDNEGGLVHLAACLGQRSLVVFGPTPSDFFGYPGNINIDPLRCGGCWWIDELWMDRCPRGMAQPECVHSQPPERLVERALDALAGPQVAATHRPTLAAADREAQ